MIILRIIINNWPPIIIDDNWAENQHIRMISEGKTFKNLDYSRVLTISVCMCVLVRMLEAVEKVWNNMLHNWINHQMLLWCVSLQVRLTTGTFRWWSCPSWTVFTPDLRTSRSLSQKTSLPDCSVSTATRPSGGCLSSSSTWSVLRPGWRRRSKRPVSNWALNTPSLGGCFSRLICLLTFISICLRVCVCVYLCPWRMRLGGCFADKTLRDKDGTR